MQIAQLIGHASTSYNQSLTLEHFVIFASSNWYPHQLQEDLMEARFNFFALAPDAYKAMAGLEQYLRSCGIEERLLHLIKLRASQINGCAFCIDLHWKDLRALNEPEHRLYSLDAWRECAWYTPRERAALAWSEALTMLTEGHVSDSVYEEVRPHFTEKELSDLTLAVVAINGWNRICIAARTPQGGHTPSRPAK